MTVRSLAIASLLWASGFPPTPRSLLAQVHVVWVVAFCCITWSMRPLILVWASRCCCSDLSNTCFFFPALGYIVILPSEERWSSRQIKQSTPRLLCTTRGSPPKVQPKVTADEHLSVFMHSITLDNQSKNHNLSWPSPNSHSKDRHCLLPCLTWLF